jgi:hypothetical protein
MSGECFDLIPANTPAARKPRGESKCSFDIAPVLVEKVQKAIEAGDELQIAVD